MNRRLLHFAAIALRCLAIVLLLAIPVACGIAWRVGSARHQYVQVFGRTITGETSCRYVIQFGTIIVEYYRGWSGTAPQDAQVIKFPGLEVTRMCLTLSDPTRGEVILDIRIRPWFLLVANIPFVLLSLLLAWPMLRRRPAPGRCPVCGYDLRVQLAQSEYRESNGIAAPARCPECGTESPRVPEAAA